MNTQFPAHCEAFAAMSDPSPIADLFSLLDDAIFCVADDRNYRRLHKLKDSLEARWQERQPLEPVLNTVLKYSENDITWHSEHPRAFERWAQTLLSDPEMGSIGLACPLP